MADYDPSTVPRKVNQLYRSQVLHTRINNFLQFKGDARATETDYMVPLIADADTGHGNTTGNQKLAKLFVEAGAAAMYVSSRRRSSAARRRRALTPLLPRQSP